MGFYDAVDTESAALKAVVGAEAYDSHTIIKWSSTGEEHPFTRVVTAISTLSSVDGGHYMILSSVLVVCKGNLTLEWEMK